MYILYHSEDPRTVPQQTDGRTDPGGGRTGGAGRKELILVAQETTLYGKDLYGEKSLLFYCGNFVRSADCAGSGTVLLSGRDHR